MRVKENTVLAKHVVRLAEEMEFGVLKSEYSEWMHFEADIAQLSELIVVFSESAGSAAEMTMFAMDEEVAPRMLVFMDDDYYQQESFIRFGPVTSLEGSHGDGTVCVLSLQSMGVVTPNSVKTLDLPLFTRAVEAALVERLSKRHDPRTFNPTNNGHLTKLIVGLVQYYGSLTLDEIDVLLFCLGVGRTPAQIRQHLLCARFYDWIELKKAGQRIFYSALANNMAIHFDFKPGELRRDRKRIRSDYAAYWSKHDTEKFACLTEASRKSV